MLSSSRKGLFPSSHRRRLRPTKRFRRSPPARGAKLEPRAPVLEQHVESQVLRIAPPSADRARKPPPLGATKPGFAQPHPRADHRFFGPHKEPVPSDTILALPCGSAPRVPHAEAVSAKTMACSLSVTTMPALRR